MQNSQDFSPQANRAASEGGVYVEFLIAFLPFLCFFSGLVQLAFVQAIQLIVVHMAAIGARSAIVILPDDPAWYGHEPLNSVSTNRLKEITYAIKTPIWFSFDPNPNVRVTFPTSPGSSATRNQFGPHDLVRIRVDYRYPCNIPIGKDIACPGGIRTISAEAALPNQGANFIYY
ncbi:pilus assembly protein [Pajaroellobacter abortibovis]|uniref:Pilus assembly protein TadE n=1 Tax=Pajaroellobacter abortibovis TaxID=1882918 RepID=A0A1L6MY77_9BACT|nr:pilus assembly protein [Pajaroellobacter abortibovis]APS00523.1 hypothetical protein BCY86_07425 [Pajaroellobacter abortibovis]